MKRKQTKKRILTTLTIAAVAIASVFLLICFDQDFIKQGLETVAAEYVGPTTPVVYVGEISANGEITTRDGSIERPWRTMTEAVERVDDGGTVYVIGYVYVNDDDTAWPDIQKNFTVKAYPLTDIKGETHQPTLYVNNSIVLCGDTTFEGYSPAIFPEETIGSYTSAVALNLVSQNSQCIYPESHSLTLGRIDATETPLNDVVVPSNQELRICTGLSEEKAHNKIDIRLYGSGVKKLVSGSSACFDEGIFIENIGGSVYASNGGIDTFTLGGLKTGTGDINIRYKNTYLYQGVISSSTQISSNLSISLENCRGAFCLGNYKLQNLTLNTQNCSGLSVYSAYSSTTTTGAETYNFTDSTGLNFYYYYNYDRRFSLSTTVHNCASIPVFNVTRSTFTDFDFASNRTTSNYGTTVAQLNCTDSTISSIVSSLDNYWDIHVSGSASTLSCFDYITADFTVSAGATLNLGTERRKAEFHNITLGKNSVLNLTGGDYWLSGDLTADLTTGSRLKTNKVQSIGIKGEMVGSLDVEIKNVTGSTTAVTSDVLVNIGAEENNGYINYLGTLAIEGIIELQSQSGNSVTYMKSSLQPTTDSNAIYVRFSGSDANNGTSYQDAVATTKHAYELAAASGNRKKIVICGQITYYFDGNNGYRTSLWRMFQGGTNAGDITITALAGTNFGNASFNGKFYPVSNGKVAFDPAYDADAETTFENVEFSIYQENNRNTYDEYTIFMYGHKTVIGAGVITQYDTSLRGGAYNEDLNHGTDLTVYSGTYYMVYGGTYVSDSHYRKTIAGNINLSVYGASFHNSVTYLQYYSITAAEDEITTGDVHLTVGGQAGFVVRNITGVRGVSSGTVNGTVSATVDGSNDSVVLANAITYGLAILGNGSGSVSTLFLTVQNMPGHEKLGIVAGPAASSRTICVTDVDVIHSVMGSFSGSVQGGTTTISISYRSGGQTELKGGIYAQGGDYSSGGSSETSNLFVADNDPENVNYSGTISNNCRITLNNVVARAVCGSSNGYRLDLSKIQNHTLTLSGECAISAIRQFSMIETTADANVSYSDIVIESSAWNQCGRVAFENSCTYSGTYTAFSGAVIEGNERFTFEGEIHGTTLLEAYVPALGTAVVSTVFDTQGKVTEGSGAFSAQDIEFDDATPIGGATWSIVRLLHDKREVVFVRDQIAGEPNNNDSDYLNNHDGSDYEHAFYTLAEGFRYVQANDSGVGTIVVCGPLSQNATWNAAGNDDMVEITSVYDGTDYRSTKNATMNLVGDGFITMNGPWTVRCIDIRYSTDTYIGIDANGYTLIFGTDITPDIVVDRVEGARRCVDCEWISVNSPVSRVTSDVTVLNGNANPTNFYLIGGGYANKALPSVDLRVYNTTVGRIIGMYSGSTISGDLNLVIRDTEVIGLSNYVSLCTSLGTVYQGRRSAGTGTVHGDISCHIEVYSKASSTLPFLTHTYYVSVSGDGERCLVNKSYGTSSIPWVHDSFALCSGDYYELYDGLDDISYGFSAERYTVQDASRVFPLNTTLTFLGGYRLSGGMMWAYNSENVDRNCRNNTSIDATGHTMRINIGNASRGSFAILGTLSYSNAYDDVSASSALKTLRELEIHLYPNINNVVFALSNEKNDAQKNAFPLNVLESAYPIVVFHSTDSEVAAGVLHSYDVQYLKEFSITADASEVVITDEDYSCAEISAINGGVVDLSGFALNVSKSSIGLGGNLSVINGGSVVNYDTSSAVDVENRITIQNAEFNATSEKVKCDSLSASVNASILLNEGSSFVCNSFSDDFDVVTLNFVPSSNPVSNETGAQLQNMMDGAVLTDKVVAGKNQSGFGSDLNALNYSASGTVTTWKIGAGALGEMTKIYIKDSGSDSEHGGQRSTAVKTLEQAFYEAYKRYNGLSASELNLSDDDKLGDTVFYVTVCDTFTLKSLSSTFSAYYAPEDYRIVLTADNLQKQVLIKTSSVRIPAEITIENLTVVAKVETNVFACGYTVVFGDGIHTLKTGGTRVSIYGGDENATVASTNITVKSGSWYRVYGGGKNGDVTGNTSVTIEETQEIEEPKAFAFPSGYVGVEYIQSTGEQYIASGLRAMFAGYARSLVRGDYTNASGWQGSNAYTQQSFSGSRVSPTIGGSGLPLTKDSTIETIWNYGTETLYVDGSLAGQTGWGARWNNLEIQIFALGGFGGTVSGKNTLYYAEIEGQNNKGMQAKRVFIPCLQVSTGKYGLFDIIERKFYGSASSSQFIGGPRGEFFAEDGSPLVICKLKISSGGAVSDVAEGDDIFGVFGGGENGTVGGNTEVCIRGGVVDYVYGGGYNVSAKVAGNTSVTAENSAQNDLVVKRVYGGGYDADILEDTEVVISSGEYYMIIGGGSRRSVIEGNTTVNFEGGVANRVYGGGYDEIDKNTNIGVQGTTTVTVGKDNAEDGSVVVHDFLRGSGGASGVGVKSVLYIKDGAELDANCSTCAGGYSGAAPSSELYIQGGVIHGDAFAGSAGMELGNDGNINNNYGKVGSTILEMTGGIVEGSVFAGGDRGYVGSGSHSDVLCTTTTITGGTIQKNLLGGSNLSTVYGNTQITIDEAADVEGKVFGGGKGPEIATGMSSQEIGYVSGSLRANNGALVTGNTHIILEDGSVNSVYGGCDARGEVSGTAQIDAEMYPTGSIFGGGYGEHTNVVNSIVNLEADENADGECTVYGGGEMGTADETAVLVFNWTGEVYGGGKGKFKNNVLIDATATKTTVSVTGTQNGNIYGGGEVASVSGATGTYVIIASTAEVVGDVFGGGKGTLNQDHANTLKTTVQVNGKVDGNVYGGGELASVGAADETGTVTVVAIASEVTGDIYGGGKGDGTSTTNNAQINGNTCVTIGTDGDVETAFGGGEIAPVAGNTYIAVVGANAEAENIFGGNDVSGNITGSIFVVIEDGSVVNVYGGGKDAAYNLTTADAKVSLVGGEITNAYGGGYGQTATVKNTEIELPADSSAVVTNVYGGGEKAETVDTEVKVLGGTVANAYCGGNEATVSQSTTITVDTGDQLKHVETIFGGNNMATMSILPTFVFDEAVVDTVYCGGNEGILDYANASFVFDYPGTEISTLYAGCNNTSEDTSDVVLTLKSGIYTDVFGGNNTNGSMGQTHVIVDESTESGHTLTATNVYGGGNHAEVQDTKVELKKGLVTNVYGGGNEASAESINIVMGSSSASPVPEVTNLYCGNNNQDCDVQPDIDLEKGIIANFYGGGNCGKMTAQNGITYTLDSEDLEIDTVFGGGNQAGVTTSVTLNMKKGDYTNVYGGSNTSGTVSLATVNLYGDIAENVYGGGRGHDSKTTETYVNVKNGTFGTGSGDDLVGGCIYGGSGFGYAGTTHVTVEEDRSNANAKIVVKGSVFGAGFGETSQADETYVTIGTKLDIATNNTVNANVGNQANCDFLVREITTNSLSGESTVSGIWASEESSISRIEGSVFGGADMGTVGYGEIQSSSGTAEITSEGNTHVTVLSGYVKGSVFGGGNGQPHGFAEDGTPNAIYTLMMGDVFGTSNVQVVGGYIGQSVFGCGQQSKSFAGASGQASNVVISTKDARNDNDKAIVIGFSIFGGGNKGNGNTLNELTPTVYGNTHVTVESKENEYSHIYLISNAASGGGIYGDGNLALVQGTKIIDILNFSCGIGSNASHLKTFYSLQRANVANITASRFVLKGAPDLVEMDPSERKYSINRVSMVNMNDSSTIKVTNVVNLLGGLTSDLMTNRQFINLGCNNGNYYISGTIAQNDYAGHQSSGTPVDPQSPLSAAEISAYQVAYDAYLTNGTQDETFSSINTLCVANGSYVEVKKDAVNYGPVKGLFTLQLLESNPGEGGGFVYADITQSTGNFVCVTKMTNGVDYMYVHHDVGGIFQDPRYEYYFWYLRGDKYNYNVYLEGLIGTTETEFTEKISAPADGNISYVLQSIDIKEGYERDVTGEFLSSWDDATNRESEDMAIEVLMEKSERNGTKSTTSLGFITYDQVSQKWGIMKTDGVTFIPSNGTNNSVVPTTDSTLATTTDSIYNVKLVYKLYKGLGVVEEIRNIPFEIKLVEAETDDLADLISRGRALDFDPLVRVQTNLFVSVMRVVPTQASYISEGRIYGGISSSTEFVITRESSFTAQFVTKYVPSAYNSVNGQKLDLHLQTSYTETYLVFDPNIYLEEGEETRKPVGLTLNVDKNSIGTGVNPIHVANADDAQLNHYWVTYSTEEQKYYVVYKGESFPCEITSTRKGNFTIPKGTMISLISNIDQGKNTYWYYYCTATNGVFDIGLDKFCEMNSEYSANPVINANGAVASVSSSRITENLIFIFDFSNVTETDWENSGTSLVDGMYTGDIILKHMYTSSTAGEGSFDVMDYIGRTSYNDSSEVPSGKVLYGNDLYSHESSVATGEYNLKDEDAIASLTMSIDSATAKTNTETLKFRVNLSKNPAILNTQFKERRFAVKLSLHDDDGEPISFPDGTVIMFNGEQLKFSKNNAFVVVPIKFFGEYEFTVIPQMYGFDAGNYSLYAELYSTSYDGYYNSIMIEDHSYLSAAFEIVDSPVYHLSITENNGTGEKNHLISAGEQFSFDVVALGGKSTDPISVISYQYVSGHYEECALGSLFTIAPQMSTSANASTPNIWEPVLVNGAENGSYRLAFIYNTKVEYWDFIVQEVASED